MLKKMIGTLAIMGALLTTEAEACTTFRVDSKDGNQFHVMNMELYTNTNSTITQIPRGHKYEAKVPKGLKPAKWTTKYGVVGLNTEGNDFVVGAMNEKGLTITTLYLPGFTEYNEATKKDNGNIIGSRELPTYLLTQYKSITEVKKAMKTLKVVAQPIKELANIVHPLHFALNDAQGESIVIEFINGETKIHDNKYKVMTNGPTFDWHETNMRNYLRINNQGVIPGEMAGNTLAPIGAGSGTLGLPGDETPTGRFVRTAFYSSNAMAENAKEGLEEAMNISDKLKVVKGSMVYDGAGFGIDGNVANHTAWRWIADQKGKKFYVNGYESANWYVVDLNKVDFKKSGIVKTPFLEKETVIEDITR